MENHDLKQAPKEKFMIPQAEIIIFDTEDVITTSGFDGEWDVYGTQDIDLPTVRF